MNRPWRGIFAIVVTPFTDGYELDEPGLRRVVRFCVEAGARGLVGPAIASEFTTLSDDERRRWIDIVAHEAGGQVPFIACVTSGHAVPAVALSLRAQKAGAGCVMSMPPHAAHPDQAGCYEYYRALSDSLDVPIMVQNSAGPVGTPMTPELLGRMCRELRRVRYIKEETSPSSRMMSRVLAAAGDNCKGVFGGQGGQYLLDEHRRGAAGSMPACQSVDLLQAVWDALEAGNERVARALHNRMLPLISYERQHGVALSKEVLYRRGVIATTVCRETGARLDDEDRAELDAILSDIESLHTATAGGRLAVASSARPTDSFAQGLGR